MPSHRSLDDLRLFCEVAHQGSFQQAARHLSMPLSTLSRRIARLEQQLNVRLLHRDAHRRVLTETGLRYYRDYAPLFAEFDQVSSRLESGGATPEGTLHISAPIDLSNIWLAPLLTQFANEYPCITIDLSVSNHNINLPDSPVDLAVRVGYQQDSHWIQRRLFDLPFELMAAQHCPQWHHLERINQLDDWPQVHRVPSGPWQLQPRTGGDPVNYSASHPPRFQADSLQVVTQAVAQGLGVALMPTWVEQEFADSERLTRVASPWRGVPRPVFLLYRDRERQPLRLKLLIEFLSDTANSLIIDDAIRIR